MSIDLLLKNGDVVIGASGDLATVSNTAKLVQDIIKMVTTDLGSNKFQPQIGSLISQRLIGQNLTAQNSISVIQASVQEALVTLQKLQKAQAQVQALSPAETLIAINDITVQRDSKDPRQLNVVLKVMAGDGNLIADTFTLRLM
jgi:hypothetical protein